MEGWIEVGRCLRMYPCVQRRRWAWDGGGGGGEKVRGGGVSYCHRANSRWQIPGMLAQQDQ